ncbi:N-acyl-D-amino-acid deacylase family protein [Pseudoalteromonas peptidolytica]|uniref:N-acyl-D-amino-acid deacylase n=1 Tax=Pseudoalteromonas peptidolytica F12-50-A1 TaxID=1315280 RepID=A0A8I0N199_9GAMM|nr:D-aminoacylase [Pseudoalteromonas peptidolytica]MBE0348986.1 N-acyl-D-amino-acid deacylase [Pseudoalteromonas peptidolytica F12-50-A1]NLR15820.1 D-aminoacylase [Pseudoalteromonas peptidolytica]GEK09505.1 D-aminoacylase [Pseudoalteromonas peptidolytica]
MTGASNYVDTLIQRATVYFTPHSEAQIVDVAIDGDKIVAFGDCAHVIAREYIDAMGLVLAPGFIDVHTHDDLEVLRAPHMLSKVSQGVTTVIAGNCGISAVPYSPTSTPVDPINLLGEGAEFVYCELKDYQRAFSEAAPSVNLAMLVGHTTLRAQVMDDLSHAATIQEINQMKDLLHKAMMQGAIGLSTGLAYYNAKGADKAEVNALAEVVTPFGGIYTTHLRTEFQGVLRAMDEAFSTAQHAKLPLVISHIKCAGQENWGRAPEVLAHFEQHRQTHQISCDCYPYAASASTLDLNQVTGDTDIFITWSEPYPELAQQSLADIALHWQVSQLDAAKRLQPAGAVYHCMLEDDVRQFLSYEHSMVGSDGLPCDPHPHPRLWGTFPRVLGHYCREQKSLPLALAIHKMTALPAARFKLKQRGSIQTGYFADLVLFDPKRVLDRASYSNPKQLATGIVKVWVNGTLSYVEGTTLDNICEFGRAGRFLNR